MADMLFFRVLATKTADFVADRWFCLFTATETVYFVADLLFFHVLSTKTADFVDGHCLFCKSVHKKWGFCGRMRKFYLSIHEKRGFHG